MRVFNPGYLNTQSFYGGLNPVIQVIFPSNWPSYYAQYSNPSLGLDAANSFAPLNLAQQAGVRTALNMWSNYVSVTFTDAPTADGKKISFGFTSLNPDAGGVGFYPQWFQKPAIQGDVFFNTPYANKSFTPIAGKTSAGFAGRESFALALHEIGHALGLDHAGGNAPVYRATPLPVAEQNTLFSVMAYDLYPAPARYAITPMLCWRQNGNTSSSIFRTSRL